MAKRPDRVNAPCERRAVRGEKTVVIGAGVGGLTAATLLAARGCDVTVVEKADAPGGKMRQLSPGGRPIDAGPTVFTMRWVFDEIFDAAGACFADEVALHPLAVLARHAWSPEQCLDLFADIDASVDAIAAFSSAAEAARYRDFCDQAARTYATLERPFLRGTRTSALGLTGRIGLTRLGDMASIRPFASLWRVLGRHFQDPRLRQLFGRYATYSGSSPFLAPATLMLIAHVERAGVWAVGGGMHAVAQALQRLAERQGARFRFGAGCRRIEVSNGAVSGVVLDTGETIAATRVVANCDPSALGAGLFGAAAASSVAATRRADRSLSALCWVIDAPTGGFDLTHHNVFFSGDYLREFDRLTRDRAVPDDPSVYVCAQDRSPACAMPGPGAPERLQIIVNAPADGDIAPLSSKEIDLCATRMRASLARCGLTIDATPDHSMFTSPKGFEALFPATGGALYGRATHGWAAAFRRPGARTRLPGLYLAGGATHPGAGVPMAALSGCRAAESVLADCSSTRPSRRAVTAGGMSMRSARTGASG
jgi:1-hydroxycarotenoid 3,4-desaturase